MLQALLYATLRATLRLWFRRSLPKAIGQLIVPGLQDQVEILRDRWGVPHIYAANEEDLFFAQGFVHAQDRLWQMELHRRSAQGTLCEVLGSAALAFDRLSRRLDLRGRAEQELASLEPPLVRVLEAYTTGAEAFVSRHRKRLPPEFALLRYRPAPWTPVDSLSVARFVSWTLSANWDTELVRGRLLANLDPQVVAYLEPGPGRVSQGVPWRGTGKSTEAALLESYRHLAQLLRGVGWSGSNAWAVDGSKSATGKPLLACDPHLALQLPTFWYEVHLEGSDIHAVGASVPGLPGILLGYNQHIAWGSTAGMADTQDLYLEELASEDQARYRWQGGWEQGRVLPLEFHVKGRREPLRETCLVTRHGPDIAPALDMEGPPLVLHSTVLELPTPLASALQLLKARSWEEFRRLLEGWTHPCLNFIYADVRGNIGYQLAGRIPHRGEGQGLAPLSGWSGQHQWRGYIPFEELPSLFNPPSHYVASANDRMVGDDYPYALGLDWADDFRVRRIRRVLEGKRRHSLADFQGLQMDQYSLVAEQLTPWLLKVARQEQDLPEAARLLEGWDSRLSSETAAAALFQVFVSHLQHALFQPQLGPLTEHYLGKGVHPILPANSYAWRSASKLLAIVQEGGPPWLKGPAFEQQARRSLREAWVWLEQHLGPDPSTWRWGDLHQLSLRHIFGSVRALAPLFNIGPFPLGGDTNTVNAASFATWSGYEVTGFTPSLRYVVDLGDPARSVSVIPGGQGGHPLSRHYADQMSLWLQGRYHPMLLNREALGQHIEARLLLKPAKA